MVKASKDVASSDPIAVRYARLILKRPFLVVLACLLSVMVIASGARFLQFDTNYRVFFSESNPQLEAFDALEKVYSKTDNILFTIQPKEGDVFAPDVLSLIQEITEESWKLPFAQRVDSITNFQYSHAEGDELIVEDLVEGEPESLSVAERKAIKQAALAEPVLVGQILSADARTTGVNVTINLAKKDANEVPITAKATRALVDSVREKYPDITVRPSGMVMMNNAFMESSLRDMIGLVPAMYLVLLLVMVVFLRSLYATLATTLVIAFSAASAMGFGGWIGFPLTPPSATVPTIVLTIAVADSIHIIITMLKAMQSGVTRRDAIIESLRINMQPVLLTSLTTCIGFLALNFSDSPPFQHLGTMSAFGVMMAFIYSVTLLPALLLILPIKVALRNESKKEPMEKFADFIIDFKRPILFISVAVTLFFGYMATKIELNDQFVQYFDHSIEFRGDTEFMVENLTGIYGINYDLSAKSGEKISTPVTLEAIERFTLWLRDQPEVRHVYSLSDIMKRLNKNMHSDEEEWYKLPESAEMAGQYLLLYEMSLPYGLDLNDRINLDKTATRMSVWLDDMTTRDIRNFKEKSEEWLVQNAPSLKDVEGTSPVVMFAYISERNINAMTTGNLLSLLVISLCIMVALRSIKIGLFSIVPNLVPIVLGYGLWAMIVGQINMAVAICAAVSLGIIVDDSVHFLSKYLRARREKGLSSEDAVRYAFTTVGPALIITTCILMIGFGILSFSAFQLNAYMGLLTMIVIGSALVADFFLLPTLLMVWENRNERKKRSA